MMGVAYKLSAVNVPSLTERGAMCIAYCFVGPFPPPLPIWNCYLGQV